LWVRVKDPGLRVKRPGVRVTTSELRVLPAVLLAVCFLLGLLSSDVRAQEYPRPWGYVSDFADVIPEDLERKIGAVAQEVEQKTTAEIAVVTIPTTGGIEIHDYSVGLFTDWEIGKAGEDNGILIVAAINDRKLWIKTGYGLEHVIPDAVASRIYRDVLRPAFRAREYGWGLLSAVRIVASRIAESEGVALTSVDSLVVVPQGRVVERGSRPLTPFMVFFIVAVVVSILRMRGSRGSRRHAGFPFWTIGGFSGGTRGGGFGGGFGGFGGGGCGGGGAGGGW
jgi:uncharacterized protein